MFTAASEVANASNICFVNSIYIVGAGISAAGYAYFPANSQTATRMVMDKDAVATFDNGTFAHEFGHWFNLYHTHHNTEDGNTDPDAEHVPRTGVNSNCTIAGDLLCDTEADPSGPSSNCVYAGGASDFFGNPYVPQTENIMSYYSDLCGGDFTMLIRLLLTITG